MLVNYRYYYPDDAVELIIIRVEDNIGFVHYQIKCKTIVKKYFFWGDLVEKFSSVYIGFDHKYRIELAKFKTAEEAESVASKFRFNHVDVVKTMRIDR